MSIQEIVKILTDAGIEQNEANTEVKLLIEHFCNMTAVDIIMGKKLDSSKLEKVKEKALYRAKTRIPIQQIIGYGYFMNEKFKVTKDTLIPRDETEFLVRISSDIINKNNFKKVLDIGTGTGCIACMISKYTPAEVLAIDISLEALQIALDNVTYLGLTKKVLLRKSDLFSNVKEGESFDIIVSNPPYIPIKDKGSIQKEVSFDPDIALYTNDTDGIEYYDKIICQSEKFLNKNGYIAFEIGLGQSDKVKFLFEKYGYKNITITKDLAGIDRVITAQKSK
jgi:release factor glutamine methyltransferase